MKPPKEAPDVLLRAADAAVALWRTRKPFGKSMRYYAEHPTLNWESGAHRFAKAAAKWWLIQHPQHRGEQP
jgi:hypothetical protein